jgi:hypothetical protein
MAGEGAVSALLLEVRLISIAHDTDGFESEPVTDVHIIIQALETSLEVPYTLADCRPVDHSPFPAIDEQQKDSDKNQFQHNCLSTPPCI